MSVSKAEYLKRYLSDPAESVPKKKRKKKVPGSKGVKVKKVANLKIHDDDANDWARQPPPAEDEDNSDGGIMDGAQVLRDQYDDQYGDAALVYNPDDDVAQEEVVPTFRGKNTFTSVGGGSAVATAAVATSDDGSPPRRQQLRHDSDDEGDTSPPRRPRHDSDDDADASPPRRQRHDSDDDDDDAAPVRRQRHDSDSDDASPPRRRGADSDGDASPRRRPQHGDDDDDDASPPRRSRGDDDASPPRRRCPPAAAGTTGRAVVKAVVNAGGLVDAASLKAANAAKKQKLQAEFAAMEDSGREAETTIRDKATGKRLNPKLEKLRKRQEEEKKRQATEAKMKWGGAGSANVQAKEDKMREDLITMAAPLARGRDDARLNNMQMETLHADDPMAAYIMKQREKTQIKAGIKAKPKYKGPWPANRYNLAPGHLWDGVDRSNGFEKKYFKLANQQAATNIDAYKWSTENM